LGLGDNIDRNFPTLLNLNNSLNIIQICSGGQHSMLLNKNGQVYSFGLNQVIFNLK
jgi:alpha-tubulin suppressor-like RCC1 family protein